MFLSSCGGDVDDFKGEVNEAIGSSDFELVWADCDWEVRRLEVPEYNFAAIFPELA